MSSELTITFTPPALPDLETPGGGVEPITLTGGFVALGVDLLPTPETITDFINALDGGITNG